MILNYSYDDEYGSVDFDYEVDDMDTNCALTEILFNDLFGDIEGIKGKEAKTKIKASIGILISNYDLREKLVEDYNEQLHDYFQDDAWDWFNNAE